MCTWDPGRDPKMELQISQVEPATRDPLSGTPKYLTHFMSLTLGFLGGIERDQWQEMD